MIEVPLGRFDIYALALPRGHGFGDQIPHEAWEADDGKALAIITRHADHGDLGLIVMRRRTSGQAPQLRENVRNLSTSFWRSMLTTPARRCLVPVKAFAEFGIALGEDGKKSPH